MFFSSSKNLMLVNERVLIIYPSDLFSVEFSSGISTPTLKVNIQHFLSINVMKKYKYNIFYVCNFDNH